MVVRRHLGIGLALSLFLLAGKVSAQSYLGDDTCGGCHDDKYQSYLLQGHKWQLVHTAGQQPAADLYPWGVPLPALPDGVTWDQIEYIIGNYKEGAGSFVYADGYRNPDHTGGYSCAGCHTTGFVAGGHQLNHLGQEMPGTPGTWALPGIQCEACHGRRGPADHSWTGGTGEAAKVCNDCHASDAQRRIDFRAPNVDYPFGYIYSRQGEELAHSPHKEKECSFCHDPHKTVWFQEEHADGGIRFAVDQGKGNMCKQCHSKKHVRGAMGELGLECIDCHMPKVSAHGPGASHIFRIMTDPIAAVDNTYTDGTAGKTWWNVDANGDSALTLDLVCARCHENMTLEQLATAAPGIHRQPGLVDLTVNGSDDMVVTRQGEEVKVAVDVKAAEAGLVSGNTQAQWWICASTTWGWYTWTGTTWKPGLSPSFTYSVVDVPARNLWDGTVYKGNELFAGWYTFWFGVFPTGGGSAHLDSVPLYIAP